MLFVFIKVYLCPIRFPNKMMIVSIMRCHIYTATSGVCVAQSPLAVT
jgi:hypothetical protein